MKRLLIALVIICLTLSGCAQIGANDTALPDDLSAPFKDGETFSYEYYNDEVLSGRITYHVEKEEGGWHLYSVFEDENGALTTGAHVLEGTLKPVSSYKKSETKDPAQDWQVLAQYTDAQLKIQAQSAAGPEDMDVNLPNDRVFDNESVIMAFRTFPLAEGFTTTIRLAVIQLGQIAPMRVAMAGYQDVDGQRCLKVTLAPAVAFSKTSIAIYYSDDETRAPVMIEQGEASFRLTDRQR